MKKILLAIILLYTVIVISSCIRANFISMHRDFKIEPTSLSKEEIIITKDDLNKLYREIGFITVEIKDLDDDKVFKLMQKKAKKVGADAVIKVKTEQKLVMMNTNIRQGRLGVNVGTARGDYFYIYEGIAVKFK